MTTNHTPGPWYLGNGATICAVNHGHITTVMGNLNETGKANARLISAAPDLLKELIFSTTIMQRMVDFARKHGAEIHQADQMQLQILDNRAAIARARGES